MSVAGLVKAAIINLDSGKSSECLFNPREYTITKANRWSGGSAVSKNLPAQEFAGGEAASLSLELYFDTLLSREDVRKAHTDAIWKLMMVDESLKNPDNQTSRPPHVRFQWGRAWAFDAIITNLEQTFSLFLPDGTPVRAKLNVTFRQLKDSSQLAPQNPTSGGDAVRRRWRVKQGENLALIAWRVYKDCAMWRRIAACNNLQAVRELPPGLELELPDA